MPIALARDEREQKGSKCSVFIVTQKKQNNKENMMKKHRKVKTPKAFVIAGKTLDESRYKSSIYQATKMLLKCSDIQMSIIRKLVGFSEITFDEMEVGDITYFSLGAMAYRGRLDYLRKEEQGNE